MFGNIGSVELVMFFLVILVIIPGIFFLLTLQKALERCSPENRTTSPGSVWLWLIPLFNLVWQFILITRISESLYKEYTSRGLPIENEPGKSIGLAFCILNVCGFIPLLGMLASIGAIVCWIIYWVKISGYSNKLAIQTPLHV